MPWLTTVTDLYMTDMALERSHWWIAFITMFPFYMLCNWWGAMTIGLMSDPNIKGKIYGPEEWATNVPITILYFFILGLLQSLIFYLTAILIDRIWPKRKEEQFNYNTDFKSFLDSEPATRIN